MSQDKLNIGMVVVGHPDAGKSTICGRLIYELGGISERDLAKLKKESQDMRKGYLCYAFYMDRSKDERTRGFSIACCTRDFYTNSYHYTMIDAPGLRDFIKNTISGISQADIALLMVPANKGGFETSIAKGNYKKGEIEGQTRQHARLCHLLGIKQLIVCINKMDVSSVNWSQNRYNEIKQEVDKMLT
eukprot:298843_1